MSTVSVIVTCYNEENYIEQALLSVLNQTRFDLIEKIIVVDDESNDDSLSVIKSIASLSPKIEVIAQKNSGLAIARNNALEKVHSEWICFLDGDDIWPVNKIEKQIDAALTDSEIYLVYTDSYRFGMEERYIMSRTLSQNKSVALIDYFLNDAPILSSLMIKMQIFRDVGFFDPELRMAQDTEMWARAVAYGKTCHIKEPLLFRRIHSCSLSSNFEAKIEYRNLVIEKLVVQFPQLLPYKRIRYAKQWFEFARMCIKGGKRLDALKYSFNGLRLYPGSLEGCTGLLISMLPFSKDLLRIVKKIKMRSQRINGICLHVPRYDKKNTIKLLQNLVVVHR